jgi:hypothetical protein
MTCVRYLVVRLTGSLMTVYPLDGYQSFSVVWCHQKRFMTVLMNRTDLDDLLQGIEDGGGSVEEVFDWDHDPFDTFVD